MMRRTFRYLDCDMFRKLFTAVVRPHLEYGAVIWNPTKKHLINQIESVQRRATKLIPGMSRLSYKECLTTLHIPTLQYRRYRGDMIEAYKISHNLYDPETINSFIKFNASTHYHLRRHEFTIYKDKFKKEVRKNSFKHRIVDQ